MIQLKLREMLEKMEQDMIDSNNHLDLILYFNELNLSNFLCLEIDLIKWLFTKNKN